MLFMGEEWGATTPWQYFTDHQDPELAEAVREGRRREFTAHEWAGATGDWPDPQDPATRDRCVLDWTEPAREPHTALLAWHRTLLALRHELPPLTDPDPRHTAVRYDEAARWLLLRRGPLRVAVNLSRDTTADVPVGDDDGGGAGRGAGLQALAGWPGARLPGADGVLRLPPESAVVLGP